MITNIDILSACHRFVAFERADDILLADALEFFARELMSPDVCEELSIDVIVGYSEEFLGKTSNDDDMDPPRFFTIKLFAPDIYTYDINELIQTIAHEMIHVKQMAYGQLMEVFDEKGGANSLLWCGKKAKFIDVNVDSPWEIEAYSREVELYQKWLTIQETKNAQDNYSRLGGIHDVSS